MTPPQVLSAAAGGASYGASTEPRAFGAECCRSERHGAREDGERQRADRARERAIREHRRKPRGAADGGRDTRLRSAAPCCRCKAERGMRDRAPKGAAIFGAACRHAPTASKASARGPAARDACKSPLCGRARGGEGCGDPRPTDRERAERARKRWNISADAEGGKRCPGSGASEQEKGVALGLPLRSGGATRQKIDTCKLYRERYRKPYTATHTNNNPRPAHSLTCSPSCPLPRLRGARGWLWVCCTCRCVCCG